MSAHGENNPVGDPDASGRFAEALRPHGRWRRDDRGYRRRTRDPDDSASDRSSRRPGVANFWPKTRTQAPTISWPIGEPKPLGNERGGPRLVPRCWPSFSASPGGDEVARRINGRNDLDRQSGRGRWSLRKIRKGRGGNSRAAACSAMGGRPIRRNWRLRNRGVAPSRRNGRPFPRGPRLSFAGAFAPRSSLDR